MFEMQHNVTASETVSETEGHSDHVHVEAPEIEDKPVGKPLPNRREIRAAGGRPGLYRLPRKRGKGAAKGHWLVRLREQRATEAQAVMMTTEDALEFAQARRVVTRQSGKRWAAEVASAAYRAARGREAAGL